MFQQIQPQLGVRWRRGLQICVLFPADYPCFIFSDIPVLRPLAFCTQPMSTVLYAACLSYRKEIFCPSKTIAIHLCGRCCRVGTLQDVVPAIAFVRASLTSTCGSWNKAGILRITQVRLHLAKYHNLCRYWCRHILSLAHVCLYLHL